MFRRLHDTWSHHFTGGLGLGIAFTPTLDAASRLLGVMAILVSIYCSLARNRREQRAAAAAEERARSQQAGPIQLGVFPRD